MKTYNHTYIDEQQLADFLQQYHIADNSQLLIQVFTAMTDIKSIQCLQASLQKVFSQAALIGASSDGNIIDGKVPELGQTTLSFTQFESTSLTVACIKADKCALNTGKCLGQEIVQSDSKAIICFSDGIHTNGEEFLHALAEVSKGITLAGGMAGDNGFLKETFVFTLAEITSHGAVGVSLNNPDLIVKTHYNFDWQPIGRQMKITRSERNVVYEIDYQPAKSVYEKYLGKEVSSQLPMTGIEFPLVKVEKGTNIGRAMTGCLDNGALSFAGNLHEGDMVQFGIGSKQLIIDDSFQVLDTLKSTPIESIFIYSCMARRRILGAEANAEIMPFQACDSVAGFYTYGEFFYSQEFDSPSLLNQTMTMLFLSESAESIFNFDKKQAQKNNKIAHDTLEHNVQADTLAAVSNLAYTVSNDLKMLNAMLEHDVERKTQELVNRSLIDDLTKLPNRQSLLQDLKKSKNEVLVVININDFSKVNGFYGLEAADELLLKVAIKLQQHTYARAHYLTSPRLYKLPSDEYAILAKSADDDALKLALKHLNKEVFSNTYEVLGFDILVQATWVFSDCEGSEKGLIQAELAGKEARINKTNFVRYDVEQFNETQQKIMFAQQVRRAILENRLYPVFQPIYDNKNGQLVKYECLARLKDHDGSIIPPDVFIEISQMIQMYPIVTEIMIHKSFGAFQDTELNFSVNLSLEDIQSATTQAMIFKAIEHYGVAHQVTFEILENQVLEDDDAIFKFISKVKRLGAKIAIDDFGSGYANYEHLAKLQADIIKIDGSLIKKLEYDSVAISVVESMLVFAKKLNMKVIAEFVCNEAIYEQVKSKGIDYSQGFYLSEPLDTLPIT
ncbi:MAG: c-di-GMP phosphodiesterase [Thiomicrorhabdus sp.]|nr:MAG: c-di-GMP phosphodiesterase [Thiomicrorhabdus sp.]